MQDAKKEIIKEYKNYHEWNVYPEMDKINICKKNCKIHNCAIGVFEIG